MKQNTEASSVEKGLHHFNLTNGFWWISNLKRDRRRIGSVYQADRQMREAVGRMPSVWKVMPNYNEAQLWQQQAKHYSVANVWSLMKERNLMVHVQLLK